MKNSFLFRFSLRNSFVLLTITLASLNLEASTSHKVLVASNNFNPSVLTVTAGDTVTWINTQGSHNVNGTQTTFPSNPETFGNNVGAGWTYSYVFKKAGTYDYQCNPHAAMGMTGKVFVNAVSTSHKVAVTNYVFTPAQLTINVGDTVIWTNTQGSHNVNGAKSEYPSNPESFGNNLGTGWTFSYVFKTAGTYDYHCDPHKDMGMVGKITVNPKSGTGEFKLTVNFTGMTPHVGQKLWLAVIDKQTGVEVARTSTIASQNFSLETHGIMLGKSYRVDFFADHNRNGSYNAPPTDHAWRLDLPTVTGDATLNFAHNTNFTDIAWKTRLMLHFTGMTPHVNQKLTVFLKKADTGEYKDTVLLSKVLYPVFDLYSFKLQPGSSYRIDFYADMNNNGTYDAPPTDHAWRIALNNVVADTTINFAHNTNFTDIFSTTLSPVNNSNNVTISAYPNPVTDWLMFNISGISNDKIYMKIFSNKGELIDSEVIPGNEHHYMHDVSNLTRGIYYFQLISGNKPETFKILKQ